MKVMTNTWMFLYNYTFNLATFLDISFQLDLLYTNANPMKKPHKRIYVQMGLSLLLALVPSLILACTEYDYSLPINFGIFIAFKIVFYTAALISLSYCAYTITRKGMNVNHRNLLLKRHVSYCFLSIFC